LVDKKAATTRALADIRPQLTEQLAYERAQADASTLADAVAKEIKKPADLDRVAFAVDGAESSHGLDLRMWRPQPAGPQGPMQVSEAAAIDVGGGDRFDLAENRALGRAYLARMYRRYGNWPDAIAAYNWGPGNVDAWIGGGRTGSSLPLEVERYRDRVLRDAALAGPSAFVLAR